MNLGTKTLLFGVHQIAIHPFLVTVAWIKLYKSLPTWREMLCIIIHDWGYWGKPNLKDADGDRHPELGARIAGKMLGSEWSDFILGHSSFYIIRNQIEPSKLMAPDKYWHCIISLWAYKAMAVPTGEFKHYRELKHARQVADQKDSDAVWWANLQQACRDKVKGTYQIDRADLDKDPK